MKYQVNISDISTIYEIAGKWNRRDYLKLLELFEFGDPGDVSDQDMKELLYLAISEYEPHEAAEIVLRYKFQDELNDGQYEQLSHDMLKENVAEHYSDISFHSGLFDVNEFLYKAYNGKFPHAKASVIEFTATPESATSVSLDKASALRLLCTGINPHSILKRLFKDQINGDEDFDEAAHIAWYLKETGENNYQLITSEYWISNDEIIAREFEATLPEADN